MGAEGLLVLVTPPGGGVVVLATPPGGDVGLATPPSGGVVVLATPPGGDVVVLATPPGGDVVVFIASCWIPSYGNATPIHRYGGSRRGKKIIKRAEDHQTTICGQKSAFWRKIQRRSSGKSTLGVLGGTASSPKWAVKPDIVEPLEGNHARTLCTR